ncbi:MAG: hypothetical protein ACJ746_19245 [Bryobacteraceae bacterium]
MRAPTESNPTYKKRLITAMLEEPAFPDVPHSVASSYPTWSPKVVSSAAGLTLLSALTVFLFLYHRDTSAVSAARAIPAVVGSAEPQNEPANVNKQPESGAASVDKSRLGVAPSSAAGVSRDAALSMPGATEFNLKRSRTYQTVGAIGLRLLRMSPRRRTCDVSIRLKDGRTLQRRLQLSRPLELKPTAQSTPLQLTVSAMSRDSISGSLSALPASVSALR